MTVHNDARLGSVVAGRYRLDDVVGRGGMSIVYRGTDTSLGRAIAVKVFRTELADAGDLRRQRSEVELLASVNHPALVTLYDAVTDDAGAVLLVMELVDGRDLRAVLAESPLSARETASIGADVAGALAHIHTRGIVHRDVKPANVLVPTEIRHTGLPGAKLADFGIARLVDATRLTSAGSLIGTADYLSPEQALGRAVGPASDVYSLGLVLIESLTGRRSFSGSGIESAVARVHNDPAIPQDVDSGWRELLSRMTARDPAARPGAAECGAHLTWLASRAGSPTSRRGDTGPTQVLVAPAATPRSDATAHLTGTATQYLDDPAADGGRQGTTAMLPAAGPAEAVGPPAPVDGQRGPVAGPAQDAPAPGTRTSRGVFLVVVGAIVLLTALAIGAVVWSSQGTEATPTVDYPVVDGEIGSHLEQLQQSVER